jgi:hypothetical protein
MSSANRTSGTSSNYQLSLFKPIILSNPNNWFSVRIGSAEIPYTFQLLNPSNNTINYSLTRNSVTINSSFVITPGNFNILTLLNEMKNKLSASVQSVIGWNPLTLFNFTYDRNSGKATFSLVGTDSLQTSISIKNNSIIFLKCVGFTDSFTFGYTSPTVRSDVTSTQNVNLLQNTALYIRSESLIQSSNYENVVSKSEISDILAKIQVNVQPQSMILWSNPTDLEVEINNRIIDVISIYIGDQTNYELELGNLDWSMRLTIHEYSASSNTNEDLALNMSRGTNTAELEKLMDEKQKIIQNLSVLKEQLAKK